MILCRTNPLHYIGRLTWLKMLDLIVTQEFSIMFFQLETEVSAAFEVRRNLSVQLKKCTGEIWSPLAKL